MTDITGRTQTVMIIGDPVETVASPPAINARFAELGLDARMIPLHIPSRVLHSFWEVLRGSDSMIGCSITYPYKREAFSICDICTDRARRLGVVNTVRRDAGGILCGDATDGVALVKSIEEAGINLEGRAAHVIGAGGGAGRAIVDAFCEAGVTALRLDDINQTRIDETKQIICSAWPTVSIDDRVHGDILVDATANGKSLNQVKLFFEPSVQNCIAACDIAGLQNASQFLAEANKLGKSAIDARDMGRGQVDAQLAFWFDGTRP